MLALLYSLLTLIPGGGIGLVLESTGGLGYESMVYSLAFALILNTVVEICQPHIASHSSSLRQVNTEFEFKTLITAKLLTGCVALISAILLSSILLSSSYSSTMISCIVGIFLLSKGNNYWIDIVYLIGCAVLINLLNSPLAVGGLLFTIPAMVNKVKVKSIVGEELEYYRGVNIITLLWANLISFMSPGIPGPLLSTSLDKETKSSEMTALCADYFSEIFGLVLLANGLSMGKTLTGTYIAFTDLWTVGKALGFSLCLIPLIPYLVKIYNNIPIKLLNMIGIITIIFTCLTNSGIIRSVIGLILAVILSTLDTSKQAKSLTYLGAIVF